MTAPPQLLGRLSLLAAAAALSPVCVMCAASTSSTVRSADRCHYSAQPRLCWGLHVLVLMLCTNAGDPWTLEHASRQCHADLRMLGPAGGCWQHSAWSVSGLVALVTCTLRGCAVLRDRRLMWCLRLVAAGALAGHLWCADVGTANSSVLLPDAGSLGKCYRHSTAHFAWFCLSCQAFACNGAPQQHCRPMLDHGGTDQQAADAASSPGGTA